MSTILHLVRAQHRPAPIEPAARLSPSDCKVIAGDRAEAHRIATVLLIAFACGAVISAVLIVWRWVEGL